MASKKVAVITGGARGIGLVTAKTFTDKGWDITIVDWDKAELETVAAHLPDALLLGYDVSDPVQASAIVADTLQRFGRIDALINNAGVADFGPIEDTTFETLAGGDGCELGRCVPLLTSCNTRVKGLERGNREHREYFRLARQYAARRLRHVKSSGHPSFRAASG